MEYLFENFSANSWILAPRHKTSKFIKQYTKSRITTDKTWIEAKELSVETEPINVNNYKTYNLKKLILSSIIDKYQIIESKIIETHGRQFCHFLSEQSEAYMFNIDIWIPTMCFQYYRNEKLLRCLEYDLDMYNYITKETEWGEKLDFEKQQLVVPQTKEGYDDFYYPLAIMNYLGVDYNELWNALNSKCDVYLLNDM